jgi:DNA-directed RNA polymerase subunit RPC12/RpoP
VPVLRQRHLLPGGGGLLSGLLAIKDATYKWLGVMIGILALLTAGFGMHEMGLDSEEDVLSGKITLSVCVPGFFVAAIYIAYAGVVAERRRLEMEKLAGYLGAYRRIKVDALATKLGISEYEAEKRILRCVRHRLLTGYIDRASDEFFNPSGMEGKMLLNCPNCGGTVEELVLDGDSAKCPYCESVLQVKEG